MRWPDDTFSVVGKKLLIFTLLCDLQKLSVRKSGQGGKHVIAKLYLKKEGGGGGGAPRAVDSISCFLHIETMYFLLLSRCAVFKVAVVHRFRRFFFSDTALCAEKIPRKNNRSHGKQIRKVMLLPSDLKNQVIKLKHTGKQNHQKSNLYFSHFWRVDWKARHSIGANHGQSDLRCRVCDLLTTSCLECFSFTRRHTISSTSFRPRRGLETTCDFFVLGAI